MAPPPLPPDYSSPGAWQQPAAAATTTAANNTFNSGPALNTGVTDDWDDPWSNSTPQHQQQQQQDWNADDDWDSDFDDDASTGNGVSASVTNSFTPGSGGQALSVPAAGEHQPRGSTGDVSSVGKKVSTSSSKASFNRFSVFVKTGSENYILGKVNLPVSEGEVLQIIETGEGRFSWLTTQPPYSCVIASPKKEAKFKGLKSYIAYQLTPSFNNIQVSRRYKHFDWLHERLNSKFNFIPVPPLPDKQIQGRYEEEFIEHRMNQLQSFVDRVCRHPVLSQSEVFQHFLTCTDDKRWKAGKRKAEKDALIGGNVFMAIRTPERSMDQGFIDQEVEIFTKFTTSLDSAVKNMHKTAADQTQRCQTHFKREYQTVGKAFQQLGQALAQDGNYLNPNLTNAIVCTGETYEDIAKMWDDQPRNDWEHLGDMMHDYRGMLAGWPGILQVHAGAVVKKKEFEKLSNEGKIGQSEAQEIATRTDTLSYALLAEISTFHQQRVKDMKTAHQHFLQEQITFYQKITEKLQDSLRMYDNC